MVILPLSAERLKRLQRRAVPLHLSSSKELVNAYRPGGNPPRRALLCRISEKNSLAAFALTEAERGLNAASIKSSAKRDGKDYLLNGRKCFVPNGSTAAFYSVFVSRIRGEELTGSRPL
jgi:alkylation response protein AidB-like acyl-CoA dehydrogenase